MQDKTKQTQEVMAKRTAKNSVFLDLFQNKSYLLELYKTLHPEDKTAWNDTKGSYRNNQNMQRQECFKGIFA